MSDHRCLEIARIAGTKGLDGELVVKAMAGSPFYLEEGMEVHLVPPCIDAPRKLHLCSVHRLSDQEALVAAEEVGDASLAGALVGMTMLITDSEAARFGLAKRGELHEERDVVGWIVEDDRAGTLGRVLRILPNPAHPLLVVEAFAGEEKLIPFVQDIVYSVDEAACTLFARCPVGLLEL